MADVLHLFSDRKHRPRCEGVELVLCRSKLVAAEPPYRRHVSNLLVMKPPPRKDASEILSGVLMLSGQGKLMGRHETFADCVVQHLPYLKRIVRTRTRNDPMADDIVQETMLKALVHADEFRFESTLKTWLTSIAVNEIRQLYRCKWRMCSAPLTAEDLENEQSPRVDSPRLSYLAAERDALIREAVSRLPESYRAVVELCDLQCLPLEEAATRLRLTVAAVKTRRRRARKKLQPFVAKLKAVEDSR
jgi:RNA polymerase sigma-70 factor (ECF subfamily)